MATRPTQSDIYHYEQDAELDAVRNYVRFTNHNIMAQQQSTATIEPRTRIVGMRWIKLGEGKDPEFGSTLFLCRVDNDGDAYFKSGFLKAIEIEASKKVFKFTTEYEGPDATEVLIDTFTHYCLPTVPK